MQISLVDTHYFLGAFYLNDIFQENIFDGITELGLKVGICHKQYGEIYSVFKIYHDKKYKISFENLNEFYKVKEAKNHLAIFTILILL